MRWLFLLIPGICFASVNIPIRWEWLTGYRSDHIHWHILDSKNRNLLESERVRDLQFWENALQYRAIYRDLSFFLNAAYGGWGRGLIKQKFYSPVHHPEILKDSESIKGWAFDGWGSFGYAIDLTADRTYRTILIPMIGFGTDMEQIHQKSSGADRMIWFGPLFGGIVMIQPGSSFQFEASYSYHRQHFRMTVHKKWEISEKIKVKDSGNLSHLGWARMDYLLNCHWRVGLEGQIQYFTTRILDASIKNQSNHQHQSSKFKARWTCVSGLFILARNF